MCPESKPTTQHRKNEWAFPELGQARTSDIDPPGLPQPTPETTGYYEPLLYTWNTPPLDPQAQCCSEEIRSSDEEGAVVLVPGAKPAPGICFERVNSAGDPYGNCGKDSKSAFVKCEMRYETTHPAAVALNPWQRYTWQRPLHTGPLLSLCVLTLPEMPSVEKSSAKVVPADQSLVPMQFP